MKSDFCIFLADTDKENASNIAWKLLEYAIESKFKGNTYEPFVVDYEDIKGLGGKDSIISKYGILYGKYGKPELVNLDISFNISHYGSVSVVVVGLRNIGVDVDGRDIERDRVIHIAEKAFVEDDYLSVAFADDIRNRFFELWTLKEAYIKMNGGSVFSKRLVSEKMITEAHNVTRFKYKDKYICIVEE